MKVCSSCQQQKPPEAFPKNASRRDGLGYNCRDCMKGYCRDYRERVKAAHQAGTGFTVEEKSCSICREVKPASEFHRSNAQKDGLQPHCRTCQSAKDTQRYATDPEQARQRTRDYRAANAPAIAERRSEFWHRDAEANRAKARERRLLHLEKARRYGRECYHRHRSRYRAYARDRYRSDPEARNAPRRNLSPEQRERYRLAWIAAAGRRRALKRQNGTERVSLARVLARDGMQCHICRKPIDRSELSLDHLVPIAKGGPHAEWNLSPAHVACNTRRGAGRTPAQLHLALP